MSEPEQPYLRVAWFEYLERRRAAKDYRDRALLALADEDPLADAARKEYIGSCVVSAIREYERRIGIARAHWDAARTLP